MDAKKGHKRVKVDGLNQYRMEEIGAILREYRHNTLLSRKDFAEKYSISKNVVERVELGKPVHFHSILRLCDIHMIQVNQLMETIL